MSNYIKLIRVKHWIKNGLVFLPLFFSGNLLKGNLLLLALLGFLSFSISASIVYIINDIEDVEKDRKHPIKKKRPLASGAISIRNAYITVAVLFILATSLCVFLYCKSNNYFTFIIPAVYVIMNILYSKVLKNIPIVDVAIIALGFVLRTMYGGVITGIEVSKFLYLMIIFGSFYLGFGKRRNEIIKNGDKSRKVLNLYSKEFLDKNMYVCFALAIIAYTLWCVDPTTISRIGSEYLFWTVPLIMIILQMYSLDIEGSSFGDPTDVILQDKKLILFVLIYGTVMVGLLYI